MKTDALAVVLDGQPIGRIERSARRRLSLHYAPEWRAARSAYPLSLSLPLIAADHTHERVNAFLWGLLPENEIVIDRWAKHFQVSSADAFGLLAHVGADCPGAVQFVVPEQLEQLLRARSKVDWLSEAEIAERLRALREDQAAWRRPTDSGQFSLAGAQPKTALILDRGRFGIPSGRTPTTHILKPPATDLAGHAENEHMCLALSRGLGLPSAHSEVRRFEDEVAIVVERFDRVRAGDRRWHRIHQEDMCQALGMMPSAKYQNEGGPTPAQIVELLRVHSSREGEDVRTFLDALVFNWLIAGTDAHAKNYSLLIGARGQVRLAPIYDVASALPYPQLNPRKLKLAMKIGSTYRLHDIERRQWQKLATEVAVDAAELIERARTLARALPDQVDQVRTDARRGGLRHALVDRLANALSTRAMRCLRTLE
jgi:serine/threonine-protein kinase HipA